MANSNTGGAPTPDPKDLQKIREYLVESGIQGAELQKRMQDITASTAQFNLELRRANEHFAKMNSSFDDLRTQIKRAADDLKGVDSTSSKINKSFKSLVGLSDQLSYDAKGIHELNEKDLKNLEKKILKEVSNLDFLHKELQLKYKNVNLDNVRRIAQQRGLEKTVQEIDQYRELNSAAEDQNNYMTLMLALTKARLVEEQQITKTLGISGKVVDGIVNTLGKLGISSQFFETLKEDMREAAKSGSKLEVLKVALNGVFKGMGQALKEPMFYVAAIYKLMEGIVKSAIAYQTKTFEAAKNLGMGVTETQKLFVNFQNIAWANGQLAMTAKQLVDTYSQLNTSLGFLGPQNEQFLTATTGIQRRLGVSAEEMQNIQLFSAETGQNLKDSYGTLIATAKIEGMRQKLQLSERQILQGISKISATVFNNFKGNVSEISKAVVKATKLGTTLDQINQAGMSLLDFESSISKEFEAQLLTGRNINLAKAREAALTGDTNQLMAEITTQLGNQTQWNKMNVIQQQSLAEAFGLSKEAVDDMFRKQQLASVLGKEANADALTQYNMLVAQGKSRSEIFQLLGQQAASDAMAASVQDKMAATMERIRDTIGQMSQALMPVIEGFANVVSNATALKILFGGAVVATGLIATSSIIAAKAKRDQLSAQLQLNLIQAEALAMLLPQIAREQALTRITAIRAGAATTAGSGYLGPAALGVGVAVISAIMAYLASSGGGGGGAVGSTAAIPAPSTNMSSMGSTTSISTGTSEGAVKSTQQGMRPSTTEITINNNLVLDSQQVTQDRQSKKIF